MKTCSLYREIRKSVAPIEHDVVMYPEMNKFDRMIKEHKLVEAVESAIGALE